MVTQLPTRGSRPPTRDRPPGRSGGPRWLAVAVALTAFRFRIETGIEVQTAADPSWRFGLGWMRSQGLEFGSDVLFSYGPLGILAEPSWASSRWWLGFALLTSAGVALWFGFVIVRAVQLEGRLAWTAGLALGLGLLAGIDLPLPELAVIALAVDVYTRLPTNAARPPTAALLAGFGGIAGAMVLGKVSTGVIAAVVTSLFAVAWPGGRDRWERLAIAGLSGAGTVLGLWVLTGNSLGGLPPWLHGAAEITSGFGSAMAMQPHEGAWMAVQLVVFAALVGILVAAQVARASQNGWQVQWSEAALVALLAWFTIKAGVVRFDVAHVSFALVTLAALALATTTSLRWAPAAVGALLLAWCGLLADPSTGAPSRLGSLVTPRREHPGEVWSAIQSVARRDEHARRVEGAKADLRDYYEEGGLDAPMMEQLEGRGVNADQWDIAALWAYDMRWRPLPVMQGYAAFTPWLDETNADALRDEVNGPDAVLRRGFAIDYRHRDWDTPETQLAMACSFEVAAQDGAWSALHRAPDVCGEAERIGQVRAEPGEPIEVPEAGPDELVVATFDLEPPLGGQVLDLLATDPGLPGAVLNENLRWRFLTTTAGGRHLLRRPDRVGDRDLPGGDLAIDTIRFEDVGSPVDVTFYAVPLR